MKDTDIGSYWPHTFTKDGLAKQIGEEKLSDTQTGNTMVPIMAQPMICTHCGAKFIQGQENQPPGPCPARTTAKELKRIRS